MENQTKNKMAKILSNLSNYLLGITILCYVSGFAITNLYLGSLGVVNLDILRSRYILTGILFIIFAGAILYLLYGLWKIIKENEEQSLIVILQKAFGFSFTNIIIIYVAVPVIALFAGSAKTISPVLPQIDPAIPWRQWVNTEPLKNILPAIFIFLAIIVTVVLVLLLIIGITLIINPKDKDGVRTSRKEKLKTLFTAFSEFNYKKVFGYLAVALLAFYGVFLLSSFMELLRTGDVTSNITRESYFQVGWSRFYISIIIVYAFIAVLLLIVSSSLNPSTSKGNKEVGEESIKNTRNDYFSWIYVFTPTIAIIISVYAFGVYPYLPQQIGGGRLIPVEVGSSSTDINTVFTRQTNDIYLIDRAPDNSLFLVVDQPTNEYKIMEISNNLIESIVFYESP